MALCYSGPRRPRVPWQTGYFRGLLPALGLAATLLFGRSLARYLPPSHDPLGGLYRRTGDRAKAGST